MDPAALLNPKGARRRGESFQPQNNSSTPQPASLQFDPRALLNPKSAAKRPASEEEAERGRQDPTIAGQVSLVERLHNVHERTASPSKRARTNEEQKKKKNQHSALASGGTLDLKANNNQALPTIGTAIDLTMSDDEGDVQVVKDNSMQMICIGRLRQVYIQSHTVPFPDPKKYAGNHGSQGRIKVHFRRGGGLRTSMNIMVTDPTGKEFGRVDLKTAQALAPLMDAAKLSGLMWSAWTEPRRKQPSEGPPGSPLSTLIALTLQLYCPRKVANDIGRFLKTKGAQLEDPLFDLQRYDYFNPHTQAAFSTQEAIQPNFEPPANRYAANLGHYSLRSVEEIRNDVQGMFSTLVSSEDIPIREPSPVIRTPLYKHQKQALHFLWDKEQDWSSEETDGRKDSLWQPKYRNNGRKYYTHVITGEEADNKPAGCRGGILADEMGLGKTLSILSLVADVDSIAASQEFARKSPPPKRAAALIQPLINSRATLLVCPLSTMYNWKEQLERHFPPGQGLKWINYHGKSRMALSQKALADHDLIITTYNMIQADFQDRDAPLAYVNWFRIVLDEAHAIRNAGTKQSIAACTLSAQRRWAVTGTPVQNRLEDLGALFRFLHLHPFDTTAGFNHHILSPFKNADPEVVPKLQLLVSSVTLRRLKEKVLELELPPRHDLVVRLKFAPHEQKLHDWFEQDSSRKVNAVTSGDKLGGNRYARILTAIMNLRLICAHGRDLLNEEALKQTDGMTYDNPMEIDDDDDPESSVLSRMQAYDMLDLLDQLDTDNCRYSHCQSTILQAIGDYDDSDEEGDSRQKPDVIGYMTPCYHIVCPKHLPKLREDLKHSAMPNKLSCCPFCETQIRPALFELKLSDFRAYLEDRERIRRDPKLAKKIGGYTGPHTKTKALLEDLHEHEKWNLDHPTEAPLKSVVFSCWTTHLDLVGIALNNESLNYVRLDGRMSREARNKALDAFNSDDSVHTILVSIGAGGLGLNLTKANYAYVMEPQFNPAAEAQAVDRVHRLGQTREVFIKRFIMENSFEEKMLELQRKKRALADLTMAREKATKEQMAKQRLEDLRSLFR